MVKKEKEYKGQCKLCKQVFSKSQMTSHLKKCGKTHAKNGDKTVKVFRLAVEGNYMPMYWLYVEIPGSLTLEHLDAFLRDIWLECCGHLSCFTIDGQRYSVSPADYGPFSDLREKTMKQKLYTVLDKGTRFEHEYDYGSTTELKLRVVDIHEKAVKKPEIILLARNEPPEWVCAECGEPATQIRATGWGLDLDSLFCDNCADDDEEYYLPLVNSPRTGVCGYCG